jgi:hypothetical protein
MTIGTTHIVAPVLAAPEIVALFFAGVAPKARIRYLLGRFVLKSSDLSLVTGTFYVSPSWTMTRFTALLLRLPACRCEFSSSL